MQAPIYFSIVIPLYNKVEEIKSALVSVLNQSYQYFEMIIVDDGSTDGSSDTVEGFMDGRIRLVKQDNSGVSAARNRGIAESNYDFIVFLDADDEWRHDHLQELIHLYEGFPECHVFATNYTVIDSNGFERSPVDLSRLGFEAEQGEIVDYFDIALDAAPPVWTSATCVRKSALEAISGFPVGISSGEDLLTWARLAVSHRIAYSKRQTAIYHFFSCSDWVERARIPDKQDLVGRNFEVLAMESPSLKKQILRYAAFWFRMRLHNYMKEGDLKSACMEFRKILWLRPLDHRAWVLFFLTMVPSTLRKLVLSKRARIVDGR